MIHIRKAKAEDSNTVYSFISELEDEAFNPVLFDKHYKENLNNANHIYLVAEENNVVIGFLSCHGQILLHHNGLAFEIQEVFVDKEHRNRGVGKLLLEKLEKELKPFDPKVLEVTSNKQRTGAHTFYEQNGFVRSHYKFTKK